MKRVETVTLIEELETDGHSPLKFICNDGAVYYVKYRSGKSFDKNEINCLVFEMICGKLLHRLHIPNPELALVIIRDDSISPGQIRINKRYIRDGVIALGSKEVKQATLVTGIEAIKRQKDFSRLHNPDDLIRLAIFDLWVDNADRHSGNYNLLTRLEEGKLQFYAIDHAFTFGGLKGMNIFNATTPVSLHRKFIDSQYFKLVIKYFNRKARLETANIFLSLLKQLDIKSLVHDLFKDIPSSWNISPLLRDRIIAFLQSNTRLLQTEQFAKQALNKKRGGTK